MKICKVESKSEVVEINFEVCGNDYCCEKMKQWLNIGKYSNRKMLMYNTRTGRFMLQVREEDGYSHDEAGRSAEEEMDFCPFCGLKLQDPAPPVIAKATPTPTPKKKKFLRGKK